MSSVTGRLTGVGGGVGVGGGLGDGDGDGAGEGDGDGDGGGGGEGGSEPLSSAVRCATTHCPHVVRLSLLDSIASPRLKPALYVQAVQPAMPGCVAIHAASASSAAVALVPDCPNSPTTNGCAAATGASCACQQAAFAQA